MKFILVLIIGFVFQSSLFAQSNIISGYIINTSRDTLRGEISYTSEPEMARAVKFKKEGSTTFTEFNTTELLGFGMDQDKYVRKNFINTAEDSVKVTAFLKLLVNGEYDLYSYTGPQRKFYLLQKDTVSYFLYDYINQTNGNEVHQANYHNYLSFVTLNCEQAHRLAEDVGYNDGALADLVLKLDNCGAPGVAKVFYQKPKTVIHPILFVGALPFGGKNQQFTANFTMRFTLPKIDKHASLNIGVNYSYTYKALSYAILNLFNRDVYTKEYIMSIPLSFQYNFTTSRIQPFVNVGISGAYIDVQPDQTLGFYSPKEDKGAGFSLIAGIGIEARIVSGLYVRAEWRYEFILQFPAIGISYHF